MASTSETGHAKNVANFKDLITVCTGLGANYNPSKATIKMDALNSKFTSADSSIKNLNRVIPQLTNAVNERETVFAPLDKLAARINSAVAASDVPSNILADVKTLTRKLQGRRAKPKADNPTPDGPVNISVSQLSYDSQVENFSRLIELLSSLPGYTPNERDLAIAGLTTLLADMERTNAAVMEAQTQVANARATRNAELYHAVSGIVKVANEVKEYIKSVFTIKSSQYKQASSLKFVKQRSN